MRTALVLVVVAACGSGSSSSGAQMQALITSDWSLQPGTETYQCARKTLDHDIYVTSLDAIAPTGTHHSIVSMDPAPTVADNPGYPCSNPFEFAPTMLWGNGIGTGQFDFPQGVGLHLVAGTQIHLNLHLFNTTDQALTGTSGVKTNSVTAAEVENLARAELDGIAQGGPTIPTGTYTQPFSCRMKSDVSLIAVAPHMHKLGTHETLAVTPAGSNPVKLYDTDYTFDHQEQVPIAPIYQLHMGDTINISCMYNNTTGQPVNFGSSSNNEMCIGAFWFYPADHAFCQ
jgi:hypothetical protein